MKFNYEIEELKQVIYNYLQIHCQGRTKAITAKQLGERISLEPIHPRYIEEAIRQLRLEGRSIATGPQGIFIPITREEKKACVRTIFRRALNTLQIARTLKKAFGQEVVGEIIQEDQEYQVLINGQLEMFV